MRIRVLWGYRGRPSKERYIEAGEYSVDDESLFGLAEYLIDNHHAVKVVEVAPVLPPPPVAVVESKPKPKRRRRASKAKE